MPFVVTGTPRSATQYACRLIRALGLECTHEITFRPATTAEEVRRWLKGDTHESSWMAWAFLDTVSGQVPILHQRRNPWKVIDSLTHKNQILNVAQTAQSTLHNKLRDAIRERCPRVFEYEKRIDRAAAIVIDWNALIEEAIAEHGAPGSRDYCVDDIQPAILADFLRCAGIERSATECYEAIAATRTDINKGRTVRRVPQLSDPMVQRALEEYAGSVGRKLRIQDNRPADENKSPDQLAEMMSLELVDEINVYAVRFGYPIAEAGERCGSL